jgi:F-type H+-transporting ATPase subunit a
VPFLPFIGTIFLFIVTSNTLSDPRLPPPPARCQPPLQLRSVYSLQCLCSALASQGWGNYFKQYFTQARYMLPFNVIGDLSRILALAVRLFGNVMSGTMMAAILLSIVPLFFPVVMQLFGLLIGSFRPTSSPSWRWSISPHPCEQEARKEFGNAVVDGTSINNTGADLTASTAPI